MVNLKQHINSVHGGGEIFKCIQCSYQSAKKGEIERHRKSKHLGIKFTCEKCDFVCKAKFTLKRHQERQHEDKGDDQYPCPYCSYVTNFPGNLRVHNKMIHLKIKYPCKHCSFEGSTKQGVNEHIKSVHLGLKFQCLKCDFNTSRRYRLKDHLKHTHYMEDKDVTEMMEKTHLTSILKKPSLLVHH